MALCSVLVLLPLLRTAQGAPRSEMRTTGGGSSPAAAAAPAAEHPIRSLEGAIGADASPGSCAYYGCSETFRVMWSCQCTPGCELQNNCCDDHASTCRAPSRNLIDGSAATALRMDNNAPWGQDGAQAASQPVDAGVRVAPNVGATENLETEVQQATQQRSTVELPSRPLTPTQPSQPLTTPQPSQPPVSPQVQPPQVPQGPPALERHATADIRPRPPSDFAQPQGNQPQKKHVGWILPLAGVFATVGTVLLVIAAANKCCRRTAAPRERPGAVMPLRSPQDKAPLIGLADRQDALASHDVVSTFESQVKEAKQRAKSLTRKSHAPQARTASR